MNTTLFKRSEIPETYAEYEHRIITKHLKVGCLLVMALMPAGILLDYFVYRDRVLEFLFLRLACSALEGCVLFLLPTHWGKRYQRELGLVIALLPAFFICVMIALTDGWSSPYYAGLNLIVLAIAFVLRWNVGLSLLAVFLIAGMYVLACLSRGPLHSQDYAIFFNNMYFIALTGIIVVVGSRIHRVLRVNEFNLRYDLDKNQRMLQESNAELEMKKLQLEKSNEMLEASKGELEESNKKLQELDAAKSRFFANISHELRTPLTLLLAPLENLLVRFDPADPETTAMLQTMHANGMRLLKLINDLLDLVRMESGRLEAKREPLNVGELIRSIASAARQMSNDKHVRLESFIDPELGSILGDRDKLEKILLNLVFNALKFTPSGGTVAFRAEKRDDRMLLVVEDTGMGIAEKNLPFIFDRFWQADDSSRRKYQGVGIGLALVKEFTELQGGTVSVQSRESEGTTFTVDLPYQEAPEPVEEPADEEDETSFDGSRVDGVNATSQEWLTNLYRRAELFPALTPVQSALRPLDLSTSNKPKLLIADDEPDMLRFLISQLSREFHVLEAVDGQQAIEKASQFLPDIILLDMNMPEKDGLQACREIRELTPTQNIPIVLLTARADEETKLAALQAGASDFLAKPFSTTELKVRIHNLFELHDFQRKLSRQNQVLESTNDQLKDTIEQLKGTELQLVQSEKMRSLEKLSAGIIHEINNPLNYVNNAALVLRKMSGKLTDSQKEDFLDVIRDLEDGVTRVMDIVTRLRTFSHPDTKQRGDVPVVRILDSSLRLLGHEWRSHGVEIVQNIPEGQVVYANENLLMHVLMNLIKNAIDALRTKEFAGETPTIWIDGRVTKTTSSIIVRDNGTGIEDTHLDKIFDPFYTTKDQGEGMGLGLSICHKLIQSLDGKISVRTEPGAFCEFTLEFPLPQTQNTVVLAAV